MRLRWLAGLSIVLLAGAADAQPTTIRLASPFADGSALAASAVQFRSALAERLGGMRVELVRPTGNLAELVRRGEAELALIPSAGLPPPVPTPGGGAASSLAIFDLPLFFRTLAEVQAYQESAVGEAVLASVGTQQLVGLGFVNGGMSQLFGKPVPGPEALKGMTLRTTVSAEGVRSALALGARPSFIAPADLGNALRAGAVDTAELPPHYVTNAVLPIEQGAISEVNYRPVVGVIVANRRFWKALTLANQQRILEEARRANRQSTEQAISFDRQALDRLASRGGAFSRTVISDAALKSFRDEAAGAWSASADIRDGGLLDASAGVLAARREGVPPPPPGPPVATGTRPVFFATDRKDEKAQDPRLRFGGQRDPAGVTLGAVPVAIAPGRGAGAEPAVTFGAFEILQPTAFRDRIAAALQASTRKDVLVFVHGYSNTFADAAGTAAALAADLKLDGAVAIFSWPAGGTWSEYSGDEDEVGASRTAFVDFLTALRGTPGVGRINLVAHSMGNRLLTDAMEWANGRPGYARGFLDHVVMAAPDVYVARFQQAAPSFAALARRVTLYASENDAALTCSSSLVHGKRRAGQGGADIAVARGIDTLDATPADPQPLWRRASSYPCSTGHAYVTRNAAVLADLHSLIMLDAPPQQRFRLLPRQKSGIDYWEFQP